MERNLKYAQPYMRGEDVQYLQERLKIHGFAPGSIDGIFGRKTESAVIDFQKAKGLVVDGIAGKKTLAALKTDPVAEHAAYPGIEDFLHWLRQQIGHIYVWGAQGQIVPDEDWIRNKETSVFNAYRAICLYNEKKADGVDPIRAYDCSGLIMCYLIAHGIYDYDMSANSLYIKSLKMERPALRPGDLMFRHNGVKVHHVGVYMGDDMVIEAKGRDDGVVLRHIDASGSKYWNRYGRLERLGTYGKLCGGTDADRNET